MSGRIQSLSLSSLPPASSFKIPGLGELWCPSSLAWPLPTSHLLPRLEPQGSLGACALLSSVLEDSCGLCHTLQAQGSLRTVLRCSLYLEHPSHTQIPRGSLPDFIQASAQLWPHLRRPSPVTRSKTKAWSVPISCCIRFIVFITPIST